MSVSVSGHTNLSIGFCLLGLVRHGTFRSKSACRSGWLLKPIKPPSNPPSKRVALIHRKVEAAQPHTWCLFCENLLVSNPYSRDRRAQLSRGGSHRCLVVGSPTFHPGTCGSESNKRVHSLSSCCSMLEMCSARVCGMSAKGEQGHSPDICIH